MTSNIEEKTLKDIPFDLYVHADLADYKREIDECDIKNEGTNNYITCSTYASVSMSKKDQAASGLTRYIKINNDVKQFLAGFTHGILTDAKRLYESSAEYAAEIENVRLTDAEEQYIRKITHGDKEIMEERNYRVNIARMLKFSKLCSEQLADSVCTFVYKMIRDTDIQRNSTLAGAKMRLDDANKNEDLEAKLSGKIKSAMDNSVYRDNDIYRIVIIHTIFHFMKCVARVINRFIWHKHGPQNPGIPVFAGVLASHGLEAQFIKEYSAIKPKVKKPKKEKAEKKQ